MTGLECSVIFLPRPHERWYCECVPTYLNILFLIYLFMVNILLKVSLQFYSRLCSMCLTPMIALSTLLHPCNHYQTIIQWTFKLLLCIHFYCLSCVVELYTVVFRICFLSSQRKTSMLFLTPIHCDCFPCCVISFIGTKANLCTIQNTATYSKKMG